MLMSTRATDTRIASATHRAVSLMKKCGQISATTPREYVIAMMLISAMIERPVLLYRHEERNPYSTTKTIEAASPT